MDREIQPRVFAVSLLALLPSSFWDNIAANPAATLGVVGALVAALVTLVTFMFNFRATIRNQQDTQFYEALKRFGYQTSPVLRSSAAGLLAQMAGRDSRGSINLNRALSQRRADAVIRYLIENHGIPLRRIVTPYGYDELNPVAENTSREGRSQNRRVEIKLLVNKGLSDTGGYCGK